MPPKSLRLTKATRNYISSTFAVLPHEVLRAEQRSLQLRLEDAQVKHKQLIEQIEQTNERQEFNQLLKELPKLTNLIERITNELERLSNEISEAHQAHLHKLDPTIYSAPGSETDRP